MYAIDLTIQIVNYKTRKYLNPLIKSVVNDLQGSNLRYEILILDNASGDDLTDIEAIWSNHNLSVYYSKANGGFGAGNNFLAKHSKAKYLLLINPDIQIIEKYTISRLISSLEQHHASVIGPKLMTVEDNSKQLIKKLEDVKLAPQLWDHGELTVSKNKDGNAQFVSRNRIGNVAWVSGAFFLIIREAYEKLNGFDEKFFLYKEEEDLCLRLRKGGETVIYDADVKVLHYGSVVAGRSAQYFNKSTNYFKQKHGDEDAV